MNAPPTLPKVIFTEYSDWHRGHAGVFIFEAQALAVFSRSAANLFSFFSAGIQTKDRKVEQLQSDTRISEEFIKKKKRRKKKRETQQSLKLFKISCLTYSVCFEYLFPQKKTLEQIYKVLKFNTISLPQTITNVFPIE